MTKQNPTPDEIKNYSEINPIWKRLGLHKISNWEALSEAYEKGEKKAREKILNFLIQLSHEVMNLKYKRGRDNEYKFEQFRFIIDEKIKELQSTNESKGDKSK